jgi:hypothetical protein
LLHENLNHKEESPLGKFLSILLRQNLVFKNGTSAPENLHFNNVAIYTEMALIRDAYYSRKYDQPELFAFMDNLTQIIMKQERVDTCKLYSKLKEPLNKIHDTHPKQIRLKADQLGIELSRGEKKVFGAMQGMFNAKPDLVITIDNHMLVCEAKFTESFDPEQLTRTRNIAQVWASLLYKDLGFDEPPAFTVFKLGAGKYDPEISWQNINDIAKETYPENDRTRIAIQNGVDLLRALKLS